MPLRDRLLRNEHHAPDQESLVGVSHTGEWMFDFRVDVARLNADARLHLLLMVEAMDATPPLRLISDAS